MKSLGKILENQNTSHFFASLVLTMSVPRYPLIELFKCIKSQLKAYLRVATELRILQICLSAQLTYT